MMNQPSYFFYDYETFGLHRSLDRVAQFGGIRTDLDFNIIEEPINLYCQQSEDYCPSPQAILVTGITPEICNERGIPEAQFAHRIHREFSRPNTTILGYNSIRFDDEVTRALFYRNLINPYAYSYENGNSRWDLIDLTRATYALRPEGIEWPMDESGKASLKLENLTQANRLPHGAAHDALSDVYATIALAKLLREKQPRLFEYALKLRHKWGVEAMIDFHQSTPILHISGMFGADRFYLAPITPFMAHPTNRNGIITIDLEGEIDLLFNHSAEELHSLLYTPTAELDGGARPPLKLLHLNRAPIIAPLNVLKYAPTEHWARLDLAEIGEKHRKILAHRKVLEQKLTTLYKIAGNYPKNGDVESALYEQFIDFKLYNFFETYRNTAPELRAELTPPPHNDWRIEPLLFNYRAKNFPQTLSAEEKQYWQEYAKERHTYFKGQYRAEFRALLENCTDQAEMKKLKAIAHYYE